MTMTMTSPTAPLPMSSERGESFIKKLYAPRTPR
jgi:hypothetical protein